MFSNLSPPSSPPSSVHRNIKREETAQPSSWGICSKGSIDLPATEVTQNQKQTSPIVAAATTSSVVSESLLAAHEGSSDAKACGNVEATSWWPRLIEPPDSHNDFMRDKILNNVNNVSNSKISDSYTSESQISTSAATSYSLSPTKPRSAWLTEAQNSYHRSFTPSQSFQHPNFFPGVNHNSTQGDSIIGICAEQKQDASSVQELQKQTLIRGPLARLQTVRPGDISLHNSAIADSNNIYTPIDYSHPTGIYNLTPPSSANRYQFGDSSSFDSFLPPTQEFGCLVASPLSVLHDGIGTGFGTGNNLISPAPTTPANTASPITKMPVEGSAIDPAKESEPYAKIIWRALMSHESKAMTLRQIYSWFATNTNKTKRPDKGWQNSIRHNLSMNGAFVRRERDDPDSSPGRSKKISEWALTEESILEGIQSTTRYRAKASATTSRPHRQRATALRPAKYPLTPHTRKTANGRKGGNANTRTKRTSSIRDMTNSATDNVPHQLHEGVDGYSDISGPDSMVGHPPNPSYPSAECLYYETGYDQSHGPYGFYGPNPSVADTGFSPIRIHGIQQAFASRMPEDALVDNNAVTNQTLTRPEDGYGFHPARYPTMAHQTQGQVMATTRAQAYVPSSAISHESHHDPHYPGTLFETEIQFAAAVGCSNSCRTDASDFGREERDEK